MNPRVRLWLTIALPVVVVVIVIAILVLRGTGSTTGNGAPTQAGTQAPKKMTSMKLALDFTPNPNHTGVYVALENGWYREQGIDLTILPFSQNTFPDTLVSTGKADVGISGTEGVVLDAAANQKVVSIATITSHNKSYLVTRADSSIQRPRDLDGKTYGGYGAPYETPIMSDVIQHDGGKGQFKSVTLGTDAIQALNSHQVDFAWVFKLDIVAAEQQGIHLKAYPVTSYGVPDYYSPTFITSQTEITDKADLLHRFMMATARGYEFARTSPQEAAQLLIKGAPKGTFPDTKLADASQQALSPLYADSGHKWGIQDAQAWQGYVKFILPTGSVKDAANKTVSQIDTAQLFTNQFLPS